MTFRLLALAGLLCFGVFQMAVSKASSEPYPALYQPSFASSAKEGNLVQPVKSTVEVSYRDGTTSSFTPERVIGDTYVSTLSVFNSAFKDPEHRSDPRTKTWLRVRIVEISGGKEPAAVSIVWTEFNESITKAPGPAIGVVDSVRYEFGT